MKGISVRPEQKGLVFNVNDRSTAHLDEEWLFFVTKEEGLYDLKELELEQRLEKQRCGQERRGGADKGWGVWFVCQHDYSAWGGRRGVKSIRAEGGSGKVLGRGREEGKEGRERGVGERVKSRVGGAVRAGEGLAASLVKLSSFSSFLTPVLRSRVFSLPTSNYILLVILTVLKKALEDRITTRDHAHNDIKHSEIEWSKEYSTMRGNRFEWGVVVVGGVVIECDASLSEKVSVALSEGAVMLCWRTWCYPIWGAYWGVTALGDGGDIPDLLVWVLSGLSGLGSRWATSEARGLPQWWAFTYAGRSWELGARHSAVEAGEERGGQRGGLRRRIGGGEVSGEGGEDGTKGGGECVVLTRTSERCDQKAEQDRGRGRGEGAGEPEAEETGAGEGAVARGRRKAERAPQGQGVGRAESHVE
ncbi:hypothetical protein Tco_0277381 [Tanacetum coccineum]